MFDVLDSKVVGDEMMVATLGVVDWAAYHGIMNPKISFLKNEQTIAGHGTKLWPDHAKIIFPQFANEPYRR